MNYNEEQYIDTLKYILSNGEIRDDRTGIGTKGVFGIQTKYDLRLGFPLLTTKKMHFHSILSELLWFIEGSNDERRLAEIRYGKPRNELENKKTIWSENAEAPYWASKAEFEGDLGRIYGVQWRSWNKDGNEIDQLQGLIDQIRENPNSRRLILNAWNVGDLDVMALPPCHVMSQFYVNSNKELSCQLYQRSADYFLGAPYNIASYALLTHMIAEVCDLKVGQFIHTIGDAHIYKNHFDVVEDQIDRLPYDAAILYKKQDVDNINHFTMDSFFIEGYKSHDSLKAPMAV